MRIYYFLLVLLKCMSILFVGAAHAGGMQAEISKTKFVASLNIGPGWYQDSTTQSLLLQTDFINTYINNQNRQSIASGELFLGASRQLHSRLWGQLGVAGTYASPLRISGVILETGDPSLDNFNYVYHINHSGVSVKGKLLTLIDQSLYPYISAGLGAGFNSSVNYTSTPNLFEILPIAPFTNSSTTSFVYNVGIGLQKAISLHWQLGVGYEFSNWGKTQLGPISGTNNNGPELNHLYINQLMFNITFLS